MAAGQGWRCRTHVDWLNATAGVVSRRAMQCDIRQLGIDIVLVGGSYGDVAGPAFAARVAPA
eukprot:5406750-Lingulodinium_polyedra.AAC.1